MNLKPGLQMDKGREEVGNTSQQKLDIEVIIFNAKSGNGNELGKIKGSLGYGNLEGLTNLYLLF